MSEQQDNSIASVPVELITNKSLYTLTGASASVWIICLVIHSIFHKTINNADVYKIIALTISVLISLGLVFKKKPRTFEDWILSIINGFLIFIYATGFNTISSNVFTNEQKKITSTLDSTYKTKHIYNNNQVSASLLKLLEINWFPDRKLVSENSYLTIKVDSLQKTLTHYNKTEDTSSLNECQHLIFENGQLQKKIKELESELSKRKKNQDVQINTSYNHLESVKKMAQLENQLKILKSEKSKNAENLPISKLRPYIDSLITENISLRKKIEKNKLSADEEIYYLKRKILELRSNNGPNY